MRQRDARRTRHHPSVTLISRRLHTRSGAEPLPTIRRLLGDKCNDRHKACRPHLSHNVFDRYPTKGVTASTHTTYMEAATHMSAAQGGGLETHCHTTTHEHDRVGRVSYPGGDRGGRWASQKLHTGAHAREEPHAIHRCSEEMLDEHVITRRLH